MIPSQKTIKIGNKTFEFGKVYDNPMLNAFAPKNNVMIFEVKKQINEFPEDVQFHLKHDIPVHESIYRPMSEGFWSLLKTFRKLVNEGSIILKDELDQWYVNSNIGEVAEYNGKSVLLEVPMIDENIESLELQHLKLLRKALKMMPGSKSQKDVIKQLNQVRKQIGMEPLKEAEYQGRQVDLNKPSRSSGPKKYQVYVKNDKGNVIKVNFGDEKGGLTAKIKDPDARKAFADRHDCKNKKDRTKAGYWSCNLPRYWKALGGGENMNTYW